MKPTQFKRPRTGDRKLRVQWRNGLISTGTYEAHKLRWSDTGHDYDIIAVEYAGGA